ncbi:chemotaxis protein CheW [Noviherbaspirillum soli]|uniref:chemotaxis protein CheW n=1 Tax=Noviherbaspirillum soli TaxID=1064518 RepID=UPI00188D014A|nr:chemotaxis protein CheW [Noviherbaspirillum soli]
MDQPHEKLNLAQAGEYLSFRAGTEEYGIDILTVQEIRGYETVTRIANAPEFIMGVLNLRGAIVPIVDLRIALNVEATCDARTAVIVLDLGKRTVGMVVDSVSDVVILLAEQTLPPPELGRTHAVPYVTGIGTLPERTLILIDIGAMLASIGLDFCEPVAA